MDENQKLFFEKSKQLMDIVHMRELHSLALERNTKDVYTPLPRTNPNITYYQQELYKLEKEEKEREKRNKELIKDIEFLRDYPKMDPRAEFQSKSKKEKTERSSRTNSSPSKKAKFKQSPQQHISGVSNPELSIIMQNEDVLLAATKTTICKDSSVQTEFERTCFRCPYCNGLISFKPGSLYLGKDENIHLNQKPGSHQYGNLENSAIRETNLGSNDRCLDQDQLSLQNTSPPFYDQNFKGQDFYRSALSHNPQYYTRQQDSKLFEELHAANLSKEMPGRSSAFRKDDSLGFRSSVLMPSDRSNLFGDETFSSSLNSLLLQKSPLSAEIDALTSRLSIKIPHLMEEPVVSSKTSKEPLSTQEELSLYDNYNSLKKQLENVINSPETQMLESEIDRNQEQIQNKLVKEVADASFGNQMTNAQTKLVKNISLKKRSDLNDTPDSVTSIKNIPISSTPVHGVPKSLEFQDQTLNGKTIERSKTDPVVPNQIPSKQVLMDANEETNAHLVPSEENLVPSQNAESVIESTYELVDSINVKNKPPDSVVRIEEMKNDESVSISRKPSIEIAKDAVPSEYLPPGEDQQLEGAETQSDVNSQPDVSDNDPNVQLKKGSGEDDSDSFFDEHVPLTETSAYHLLLGKTAPKTQAKTVPVETDSSDSDDIEQKLTSALQTQNLMKQRSASVTSTISSKSEQQKSDERLNEKLAPAIQVISADSKQIKSVPVPSGASHSTNKLSAKAIAARKVLNLSSEPDFGVDLQSMLKKPKPIDDDDDEFEF